MYEQLEVLDKVVPEQTRMVHVQFNDESHSLCGNPVNYRIHIIEDSDVFCVVCIEMKKAQLIRRNGQ